MDFHSPVFHSIVYSQTIFGISKDWIYRSSISFDIELTMQGDWEIKSTISSGLLYIYTRCWNNGYISLSVPDMNIISTGSLKYKSWNKKYFIHLIPFDFLLRL